MKERQEKSPRPVVTERKAPLFPLLPREKRMRRMRRVVH